MQIITYHSTNAAQPWLAFAILPNGQQWMVHATGLSEAEASEKIQKLAASELNRFGKFVSVGRTSSASRNAPAIKPAAPIKSADEWSNFSQHHLAGRIWIVNETTREKKRIAPSELDSYVANGWKRGGPRS